MKGLKVLLSGGLFGWLVSALAGAGAPEAFIYTETTRYEDTRADRFPSGAALQVVAGGRKRPLVPGFAASADAAISFDGRRVLFSGKHKPEDAWQIWEVPLAGGAPRRITSFREDAIAPFYVTVDRIVCARRTPAGFELEVMALAGNYTERLTFTPGDHIATGVLRDGRILFEAPHAGSAGRDIFTVYDDGSGIETYRCDHGRDRHAAAEISSGDIVFETGGRLARFTSARAVQIDLPAVPGEFAGRIGESSPGDWLAAFRPDPSQPFGIYRWRGGQVPPEKVWVVSGANALQPVPVLPHDLPKRHPSGLGDREGANLLCLNAYTSRSRIAAGSVAAVRVWTLDDAGQSVALGQTAVENDGSFFVQTPADRGIRFELLDRAGRIVAAEKQWFWARRGEQRVCVGCHAGPERAPENAVPAVLLHRTDPVRMPIPVETARRGEK
jgi:hypothetical protein